MLNILYSGGGIKFMFISYMITNQCLYNVFSIISLVVDLVQLEIKFIQEKRIMQIDVSGKIAK